MAQLKELHLDGCGSLTQLPTARTEGLGLRALTCLTMLTLSRQAGARLELSQ